MKAIPLKIWVDDQGRASIRLPGGISPGEHQAVLVLDEAVTGHPPASPSSLSDFPVLDVGPWPADLSLRREDIYGDDGR